MVASVTAFGIQCRPVSAEVAGIAPGVACICSYTFKAEVRAVCYISHNILNLNFHLAYFELPFSLFHKYIRLQFLSIGLIFYNFQLHKRLSIT